VFPVAAIAGSHHSGILRPRRRASSWRNGRCKDYVAGRPAQDVALFKTWQDASTVTCCVSGNRGPGGFGGEHD
jgi:hypothetical protein